MSATLRARGDVEYILSRAFPSENLSFSGSGSSLTVTAYDSGYKTVFSGSGLSANERSGSGTISSARVTDGSGQVMLEISGINWQMSAFHNAAQRLVSEGSTSGFDSLIKQQSINLQSFDDGGSSGGGGSGSYGGDGDYYGGGSYGGGSDPYGGSYGGGGDYYGGGSYGGGGGTYGGSAGNGGSIGVSDNYIQVLQTAFLDDDFTILRNTPSALSIRNDHSKVTINVTGSGLGVDSDGPYGTISNGTVTDRDGNIVVQFDDVSVPVYSLVDAIDLIMANGSAALFEKMVLDNGLRIYPLGPEDGGQDGGGNGGGDTPGGNQGGGGTTPPVEVVKPIFEVGAAGQASVLAGSAKGDYLFGDAFYGTANPNVSNQVFRLYQATLAREPDVGGYAGWSKALIQGDQSIVQVAAGFVDSPEFQSIYGSLDNTSFVQLLYRNVLGREADATGLSAWVAALDGGQTRAQIVIGLSESQEFIAKTANAAATYAAHAYEANWTDDVYRLYKATLNREPDIGGMDGWAKRLADGTSLSEVAKGFVESQEFSNVYGALDDNAFVNLLYHNVLGRAADAAGLSGWTQQLQAGTSRAEVVLGFSQSLEFINGTAQAVKAWAIANYGQQDDVLIGHGIGDVLAGGRGVDVFEFSQSLGSTEARVLDFEAWDKLKVSHSEVWSFSALQSRLTQNGANVVLQLDDLQVTFHNTQVSTFTEDNFLF